MNPVERLLAWLWDPRGDRRRRQMHRVNEGTRRLRNSDLARQRAMRQIERTQQLVREVLN